MALDNLIFEIGHGYEFEQEMELEKMRFERDNNFLKTLADIVLAALRAR